MTDRSQSALSRSALSDQVRRGALPSVRCHMAHGQRNSDAEKLLVASSDNLRDRGQRRGAWSTRSSQLYSPQGTCCPLLMAMCSLSLTFDPFYGFLSHLSTLVHVLFSCPSFIRVLIILLSLRLRPHPSLFVAFTLCTLQADYMRIGATGGAYGRLVTQNSTVLTYEHVFNNGNGGRGEVMESWSIVQPHHSPRFTFAS